MENNHAEDFERIESLDGYLAEHFKGDDENLFRGYHFFYGAEEYFAIETTKIYESFIDEYIDEVFKDGKFSTNELSTSELLRNHLKLFFEQQYLFRLTGYEFYRLAWQPSHVRVPKEKKSAGYDVQEISPFWKSVNLRSPIYILLFKASFWRSFIQSPWESNFYGDFHPGTHQQSRKFWIEKNFISEKDFSSASNLGTRALQFLRNHRYATLCATIKAYLEERARATKEFKNRLAGKSQNNESEKVATTFADILRAIINICQKVYPNLARIPPQSN